MNERELFLDRHLKSAVAGKRVWDFCCGTGMNGLYALDNGAEHVYFTDVREQTFTDYVSTGNWDDDRFSWHYLDSDKIESNNLTDIDVIIYHGHLYHARNHFQIIQQLSQTDAQYICFESKGSDSLDPFITWHYEDPLDQWNTLDTNNRTMERHMCGSPSIGWCRIVFSYFGWRIVDQTVERYRDTDFFKWRYWLERDNV